MQREHIDANFKNLIGVTISVNQQVSLEKKKIIKSPLRYPGGKSRAVPEIINNYIRNQISMCSPFVGGGSIEIELANRGTKVYAYDVFEPLVSFWQELLHNAPRLAEKIRKYQEMTPIMFYNLQKTLLSIEDRLEVAAAFFAINRSSFSGTTLSGGMSPGHARFTESSIKRVEEFKLSNISVERMDFKESIPKHADDFLYCDPPYMIDQKLYGVKGSTHLYFDHEALCDLLKARERWVLSYNDCEKIRDMYHRHTIIVPQWSYGMGNSKKSKELLILSKEFKSIV